MKKTLYFAFVAAGFALVPAVALAAGGADCIKAGGTAGAGCALEANCAATPGVTSDLGQLDCPTGQVCCPVPANKSTEPASSVTPAAPAAETPSGYANFSLQLPSCTASGNCGLDDIVKTGVSFANLLMTLAGAMFFGTFIYGGAMYLLSFGRSEWVSKGTKAMTGAMIGMGIVLAAWTIVRYIVVALAP